MKKFLTRILPILCIIFALLVLPSKSFAIDFNGSQSSTYNLSNGSSVRIEYHGGKPHYHEYNSRGQEVGSENLNDYEAHHSDGKKPSKSTRDIVKGDKQKSEEDKKAKKKADSYKEAWEKAENDAKNVSQNFVSQNRQTIEDAAKAGSVVVIIGGVVYILWWIVKICSGWGILIPF